MKGDHDVAMLSALCSVSEFQSECFEIFSKDCQEAITTCRSGAVCRKRTDVGTRCYCSIPHVGIFRTCRSYLRAQEEVLKTCSCLSTCRCSMTSCHLSNISVVGGIFSMHTKPSRFPESSSYLPILHSYDVSI
jgi:hypothetical protein